jgi:hypothetical protein
MVIFPFDAVGSVAESFDTVTVEQERHTPLCCLSLDDQAYLESGLSIKHL